MMTRRVKVMLGMLAVMTLCTVPVMADEQGDADQAHADAVTAKSNEATAAAIKENCHAGACGAYDDVMDAIEVYCANCTMCNACVLVEEGLEMMDDGHAAAHLNDGLAETATSAHAAGHASYDLEDYVPAAYNWEVEKDIWMEMVGNYGTAIGFYVEAMIHKFNEAAYWISQQ